MLATRVIPCLDVAHGRVVKGVQFQGLTDQGDPVELAARYAAQGADELTFLDVTATVDGADTILEVVERCAEQIFIPLTVGGGVRTVADVSRLLAHGADKVGVNSAAIARPEVVDEISDAFGAQVLVVSLDVLRSTETDSGFEVTTHGGRRSRRSSTPAARSTCPLRTRVTWRGRWRTRRRRGSRAWSRRSGRRSTPRGDDPKRG